MFKSSNSIRPNPRETLFQWDEVISATWPQSWKQTNNFDRWGNRTIDQNTNNTTTNVNRLLYGINTENNQLVAAGEVGEIVYDPVGNLVADSYSPPGVGMDLAAYDAENKMTEHHAVSCSGSSCSPVNPTTFDYDGNGRRVQIYGATFWSIFVYGADGTLVYEHNGNLEHVYLNGQRHGPPQN